MFRAWSVLDTDCAVVGIIQKDTDNFGLGQNMQVGIRRVVHLLVKVACRRILTLPVTTNSPEPSRTSVARLEILQVVDYGMTQ